MGVTLPDDYCFHCHEDVITERPSHDGLAFDSCASAGCHNYHDNRALYETFLVENAGGEWLKPLDEIHQPETHLAAKLQAVLDKHEREAAPDSGTDFTKKMQAHTEVSRQWHETSHGASGLECSACHIDNDGHWLDNPGVAQCETCHQAEAKGFLAGKHGMRLAQGLSAMTPETARLEFDHGASHNTMTCNACHKAHEFDTSFAATQACLGCHSDEHSQAFMDSPHGLASQQSGVEVSCATCHMPRIEDERAVGEQASFRVEHNQNAVLRPNEKMIRPVCMQCHSLEFSIDALADPELIRNNFKGAPQNHIPSVDWARARE